MPKKAETAAAEKKPAARRTITRRKKVEQAAPIELTWDTVAERAYFISLETGADPLENWLRAERELLAA